MTYLKTYVAPSLCIALGLLLANSTNAFTVQSTTSYDVLEGPHVTYTNLRESTTTESSQEEIDPAAPRTVTAVTTVSDPSVLYGAPTMSGDILFFDNPSFAALADSTTTSDVTDGRLSFSLASEASMYIDTLQIREFGAVSLTSPAGTENTGTLARVQAPAFLTVNEVMLGNGNIYAFSNGGILLPREDLTVTPNASSNNGGWNATDLNVGSGWEGNITFDIVQGLAAQGITSINGTDIMGATDIDFNMNNTLTAIAQDGQSTAFVDKKRIWINPTVASVPEPTAFLLGLPALLMAGFAIRRRR